MTPATFDHLTDLPQHDVWHVADGTRLFARSVGEGPPVVFLHGGLADHHAALFHVAPLARAHQLIAPDLRASGRSHHDGELSWDRLADDVAALLDHLGLSRAIVGGTSMGSAVALRVALRHPGRVRALLLFSPLYPGADRGLAPASTVAMTTMEAAGARALVDGVEDALGPLFARLPPPIRDGALAMLKSFDAASVAATTRFLATGAQPFAAVGELAALELPVLLVPGADPEHPAAVAHLYAEHLHGARVLEAGSVDLMERVEAFCAEVSGE